MAVVSARIINVTDQRDGSMLIADAALGALTIFVDDVETNFTEGGQLSFDNGEVYTYTLPDVDDTNSQIDLDTPLATAHATGEMAWQYPVAEDRIIEAQMPNSVQTMSVRVSQQLRPFVWPGARADEDQEYIEIDTTTSEGMLRDMPGIPPRFDADVADTTNGVPRDRVPPASSPTAVVRGGPNFLWIEWDEVVNQDPVTYEVHVSTVNGFAPDATTLLGLVAGTGYIAKTKPDGSALVSGTTYYARVVATDADGAAPAGAQGSGQLVPLPSSAQTTDGNVPPAATAPTVKGGPTFIAATWDPVVNLDPVTYEVHISTASGFVTSGATKYAETAGNSIVIKTAAGGGALAYGTTYYVKIIAKDPDGSAAASGQGSASMVKIDGGADIVAGSIIGTDIAALTITGGLVAASTITATNLSVSTLSSISANVGTLTAGTIDAAGVSVINLNASNINVGTLAAAQIGAATIDASKLNVSTLSAISANLGTITAGTITGATFRTSVTDPKVQVDLTGLFATDSSGRTGYSLTSAGIRMDWGTVKTSISKLTWVSTSSGVERAEIAAWTGGGLYLADIGSNQSIQLVPGSGGGHNFVQVTEGAFAVTVLASDGSSSFVQGSVFGGTGITVSSGASSPTIAIDTSVVPRVNASNIFTSKQNINPTTDSVALDVLRGVDVLMTAPIQRWLNAAGGSVLAQISTYGRGIFNNAGVTTLVNAGAVADASFPGSDASSGTIAIDTTNSRAYVRVGATWKWTPLSSTALATYTPGTFAARRAGSNADTLVQLANAFWTLVSDLEARGQIG